MASHTGRGRPKPERAASGGKFDEENTTRKSGRWGANEPPYGGHEPASKRDSKRPNPEGPEYEEGGAYPGRAYDRSPESMQKPDELGKPQRHEAGGRSAQKRTAGNHPADPNRMGADWNLLPSGISDQDLRDPGGMKEDDDRTGERKK